MKIVGEVYKLPSGTLLPQLYCLGDNGQVDKSVSETLLDLVQQSYPHEDRLENLVTVAEAGDYVSPNASLPDWGVNDTNIWLSSPKAKPGHICIANENVGEFSSDDGEPQQFTYKQFRLALAHWRAFKALMEKEGKENLVGQRFEAVFP